MKNIQSKLNKHTDHIWIDIIFPMASRIMGYASVAILLGIDQVGDALTLSEDDSIKQMGLEAAISVIIPFDYKILLCMLGAIVFRQICRNGYSTQMKMATKGMVVSIICMVISCTPLGNISFFLPMTIYSYRLTTGESDLRDADKDDYSISDLQVVCDDDSSSEYVQVCGKIKNTTEYNWQFVEIKFRIADKDEKYEGAVLSCKIENVLIKDQVEFRTNGVTLLAPSDCYEICEVVNVVYDIDSSTY